MESGEMPSDNIFSSSCRSGYEGFNGRLNHPKGWVASTKDPQQFIQLSLGKRVELVAIATQGVADSQFQCWVKVYYVLFCSNKSLFLWKPYKEGNSVKVSFVINS